MSNRFTYVRYNSHSISKQEAFKSMFEVIESYVEKNLMEGRAKSLLLTALEEAYMWAGKAIRDEQMAPRLRSVMPPYEVNKESDRPERG